MFVAVSPRLCHEAKQFYTKVCESNAELKGDLSEDVLPKFLTLSQLLLFIDKSLARPFFAPQNVKSAPDESQGKEEEDSDEEEEETSEVPLDDVCRAVMVTRWLPPSVDDLFKTREVSGDTLLSSFLAGLMPLLHEPFLPFPFPFPFPFPSPFPFPFPLFLFLFLLVCAFFT